MAEKKASVSKIGKSKYDARPTASTATKTADAPESKDTATAQEETTTEPSPACTKEEIAIATEETESAPDDEKPKEEPLVEAGDAPSAPLDEDKSVDKPVLVDDSEGLSSDSLNISVLSQENIEKHTSADNNSEAANEYGDPELEEMESEVTVVTDLDNIQTYLPSQSILAYLATSPVHEVTSPVHGVVSPVHEATSPVNESKEEPVDVDNVDTKNDEQQEPMYVEPTKEISEEKKETDQNATAWELQDDEFDPAFDKDVWEPETDTQFADSNESSDRDQKSSEGPASKKIKDDYDMFDTSSWAAGTVSGFSNTSMSNLEVDINAERNFIEMMKEEMKFRTLTEEERKMMFEANERINQAEEKAKMEQNTIQKDDEPLIVKRSDSNSVEASETGTGVSLEDRLTMYATEEPDADSVISSEESSEDEAEMTVEYVGQNNEGEEVEVNEGGITGTEAPINLVASNDVPTLEVAASAASATTENNTFIPRTLSELKMASAPPPPPPPGLPKKKKKKNSKSKSSSRNDKGIPLLPPPSEEKLKTWKDDQQKAQNFVTAMAAKLANTATKTLADASSEYFHFKPVEERKDDSVVEPAKEQTPIDSGSSSEEPKVASTDDTATGQATDDTSASKEVLMKESINGEVDNAIDKKDASVSTSVDANEEVPPLGEGCEEIQKDIETTSPCNKEDKDEVPKSSSLKVDDHQDEEVPEDDSVSAFAKKVQRENEQTVSLHTEPKNNLWRKEVADAIGLVERLEEEYDKEAFPDISMFPSPLSEEEIARKASEEQGSTRDSKYLEGQDVESKASDTDCSNRVLKPLLTVEVPESPARTSNQASLFASPKSTRSQKANPFNEKTKQPSSTRSILTDSKMADKVAMASSAAANTFEERFTPRNAVKQPKEFGSLAWFSKEIVKKPFDTQASEVDVSKAARSLLEDNENFNCMCRFVAESVNEVSMELKPSLRTPESAIYSFDEDQLMLRTLSTAQSRDPILTNPLMSTTLSVSKSGDPAMTNSSMSTTTSADSDDKSSEHERVLLKPVILSDASIKLSSKCLAANFVSFLYMASKLTKVPSPFGDSNPFVAMIVESSLETIGAQESHKSAQELLFEQLDGKVEKLVEFVHKVKTSCDVEMKALTQKPEESTLEVDLTIQSNKVPSIPSIVRKLDLGKRFIVPDSHPSPFEASVLEAPRIVAAALSFLGDPVAVCRMKMVNKKCRVIVTENEHTLMQDVVRTGGIEARHRPAFWMYVALEKSDLSSRENNFNGIEELNKVELSAEEGKWHHVIKRDVERSFGNMPPHKTGAKFQSDSIVTALVTWGQNRLMKRGVKGGGEPVPTPDIGEQKQKVKRKSINISSPPWKGNEVKENDDTSEKSENGDIPTNTVSDWGAAVSPKGSFVGSVNYCEDQADTSMEEIALCGNSLSAEAKVDLQNKLNYILHTLAATYEDIGYCQGMDYVVAHLLRNLQDTIRWKAANKRLPSIVSTASALQITEDIETMNKDIDSNRVVEETIVRVMDTFFVNYNLKHMYWPELRCLKTCCRVFERLIQIKLPVLADHFEHHDLNVGLFALGWFQTLFLYLPSMPSATVCHMWDIWLVERSFKIFFRVGTAILFLSQPILLNHELEGMMTYLNTIPDATLLRPDILIPCALNIKVTNRLLQELEDEVMMNPN